MAAITANNNSTIEDIVKGLINAALRNNSGQKMIADFTDEDHLNMRFAGAGYSEGDMYDIAFAAETRNAVKEIIIQLNYTITNGQDKKRLIGNYTSPDKKDIRKKEISDVIKYTITGPVSIRLREVGFTPLGKNRECMYKEIENRKAGANSKLKTIFDNITGDLSLMAYSLYSKDPSLVRYRRSTVMPWLLFGSLFTIASIATPFIIHYYYSNK